MKFYYIYNNINKQTNINLNNQQHAWDFLIS